MSSHFDPIFGNSTSLLTERPSKSKSVRNYTVEEEKLRVHTIEKKSSNCDVLKHGIPLITHKPTKFLWISGNPIPHYYVIFIRIHIFTKIR